LFQHEPQFKTKTLSHIFNSARHCEQGEATKNPAWINQDGVKKISFKIILSRSLREDRYQPTHDRNSRKP